VKARFAFFCAVAAAAALAACGGGGGGGGGTPPTSAPATATPTVAPTGPVSGSVVFGSTATSAPLPSSVGATGTVSIPAGSGTANYTFATSAPTGGPPAILARTRASATSNTGVIYLTLTAQGNVTIDGVPGFSATPSGSGPPAGTVFYVAYYGEPTGQAPAAQSAAWVSASSTGATLSSGSLTIPATTSPVFTLTAGQSVYFVLYYGYYIPPINILGCVGVQGNTAQRQLVGVQPPTAGSSWTYSGTLTQSIVQSSPCPIPTPAVPATAVVGVQVNVTSAPGGSPGGSVDEHSVEQDAFATNTTQVTTDAIVSGNVESSETSVDLSTNKVVTTYGTSGLTFGAAATNDPPSTVNTTFADGTTFDRSYAGTNDGAYAETDTLAGFAANPATITVRSDGSATYEITSLNPNSGTVSTASVTMGAPAGGGIAFDYSGQTFTVPAWFTGGPLYSDVTVANGVQALAAACGSGSQLGGGTGNEFVRTIDVIDPALGYKDTRTVTSWVVSNYLTSGLNVGPVCVVISDTQKLYYDFLLNTPFGLYYTSDGKPLQVSTLNESFAFSANPVGYARVRSDAQTAAAAATFALRTSAIPFERAIERGRQLERFDKVVSHQLVGGVR